jgi:hypothetical protein
LACAIPLDADVCFDAAWWLAEAIRFGYDGGVNDKELHEHIEALVTEEHALFDRGGGIGPDERKRLGEVNVQLDRLWDLLRQRRAREEFGQNPDETGERSGEIVEKYLQ